MKKPVCVAVTGAAGNIGYALVFRIAAGDMLGSDQPVVLKLIEIPPAMDALRRVVMELADCAFPLLSGVVATSDINVGFDEADIALLVGARPRGAGMERKDLLGANGKIFAPQGRALNESAAPGCRILVVGNPANTNALIASHNAPKMDRRQFMAMTRLDHNRALSQLAEKTDKHVQTVKKIIIWGNHSSTQYPDISHATADGERIVDLVEDGWYHDTFIPTVQKRGAAIIKARGSSSAASAANAAIDHMRSWIHGTPEDDWVSMGVRSDRSYDVAEGVVYSYPCRCKDGDYAIVTGLECSEFSRERMKATDDELREERASVSELLG